MPTIEIKVVPGARKNAFIEEAGMVKVYLSAPAVEGKANAALIHFLAEHFGVRSSSIRIIKGLKSRYKVVNIGV